jgi:hypothetical protein
LDDGASFFSKIDMVPQGSWPDSVRQNRRSAAFGSSRTAAPPRQRRRGRRRRHLVCASALILPATAKGDIVDYPPPSENAPAATATRISDFLLIELPTLLPTGCALTELPNIIVGGRASRPVAKNAGRSPHFPKRTLCYPAQWRRSAKMGRQG